MDFLSILLVAAKVVGAILVAVLVLYSTYRFIAPALLRLLAPLFGYFPTLIASRYLFSKKERNAINVITLVAITGTMVVTAALIIVLSVFNGFQSLIHERYSHFDPDLKIIPAKGRTFARDEKLLEQLIKTDGVVAVSPVIENKAIVTYGDKQHLVTAKGVPPEYEKVKELSKLVYEGDYSFRRDSVPMTVLGGSVAYFLSSSYKDRQKATLWAALDDADPLKDGASAIDSTRVGIAGYFMTGMEYDAQYILVDYALAEELFRYQGLCTAYEIKLKNADKDAAGLKETLQKQLGDGFQVLTTWDQHEALYAVMQNEKFVAYLILLLMLIITGVNIVGSLSMIIVEKTRDIAILKSIGATRRSIRRAFLLEGVLVGGIGGTAGMIFAFLFGKAQETLGIIGIAGGESFSEIPYFPHEMHLVDFGAVFLTVFLFSLVAAWYPSRKAGSAAIVGSLRK